MITRAVEHGAALDAEALIAQVETIVTETQAAIEAALAAGGEPAQVRGAIRAALAEAMAAFREVREQLKVGLAEQSD